MTLLRLVRVVLHLFRGMAICALLFPRTDADGRQAHVRRWSARLLQLCGVSVQVVNPGNVAVADRALAVANHVTWIDIFVINSVRPHRFVAKSDIRDWPLIGWLCEQTGTIFISRGRVRDVRRIYQNLVASLRAGEHVAFFPEGTTGLQGAVLPFHANLFEAAIEARVPVQPYALRYVDRDGRLHPAAEFVGDTTFLQSLLMILRSRGMTAQLTPLRAIDVDGTPHRRELADACHAAIERALAGTRLQAH